PGECRTHGVGVDAQPVGDVLATATHDSSGLHPPQDGVPHITLSRTETVHRHHQGQFTAGEVSVLGHGLSGLVHGRFTFFVRPRASRGRGNLISGAPSGN